MRDRAAIWPAGAHVPRWARTRRGRFRVPRRYELVDDSRMVRYHVALYKRWRWARVVIIPELRAGAEHDGRDSGLTIIGYPRRDAAAAFERAHAGIVTCDDVVLHRTGPRAR